MTALPPGVRREWTRDSASQQETRARCASKWAWAYLYGFREPSTAAQAKGTRCHAIWEKWLLTGDRPDALTEEGKICLQTLPFLPAPPVPRENVERTFTDWESYPAGIKGQIDLIDPHLVPLKDGSHALRITDHKTTSGAKWAKTADDGERPLHGTPQADAYVAEAARLLSWTGPILFRLTYSQTRGARKGWQVQTLYSPAQVLEARERVRQRVAEGVELAQLPIERMPFNLDACADYRSRNNPDGCPHRARCAGLGRPTLGGLEAAFSDGEMTLDPNDPLDSLLLSSEPTADAGPALPPPLPAGEDPLEQLLASETLSDRPEAPPRPDRIPPPLPNPQDAQEAALARLIKRPLEPVLDPMEAKIREIKPDAHWVPGTPLEPIFRALKEDLDAVHAKLLQLGAETPETLEASEQALTERLTENLLALDSEGIAKEIHFRRPDVDLAHLLQREEAQLRTILRKLRAHQATQDHAVNPPEGHDAPPAPPAPKPAKAKPAKASKLDWEELLKPEAERASIRGRELDGVYLSKIGKKDGRLQAYLESAGLGAYVAGQSVDALRKLCGHALAGNIVLPGAEAGAGGSAPPAPPAAPGEGPSDLRAPVIAEIVRISAQLDPPGISQADAEAMETPHLVQTLSQLRTRVAESVAAAQVPGVVTSMLEPGAGASPSPKAETPTPAPPAVIVKAGAPDEILGAVDALRKVLADGISATAAASAFRWSQDGKGWGAWVSPDGSQITIAPDEPAPIAAPEPPAAPKLPPPAPLAELVRSEVERGRTATPEDAPSPTAPELPAALSTLLLVGALADGGPPAVPLSVVAAPAIAKVNAAAGVSYLLQDYGKGVRGVALALQAMIATGEIELPPIVTASAGGPLTDAAVEILSAMPGVIVIRGTR